MFRYETYFPIPRIQFTAFFSHSFRRPTVLMSLNVIYFPLISHLYPVYISEFSEFPHENQLLKLFKLDTVEDIRLYSISVYIPKISVKHDEKNMFNKRLPPAREHHFIGPVLALLQQVLLREIQLLKQYAGGGVHRLHQRLPKPRKMGGFAMTN